MTLEIFQVISRFNMYWPVFIVNHFAKQFCIYVLSDEVSCILHILKFCEIFMRSDCNERIFRDGGAGGEQSFQRRS